ncbi:hypothetical protein ENSA5_10340 [Enhygromyxa salina]|uniref:Uncharacterized protein n=1 Tax=Enhygromyxa salina TaxID=215803 RepID=A0A2S9YGB6_9BACT|nr:hypothetical protein [Enhygromyxa salina]PRQ04144.1 hypothetical protein ENSA5_10340 [Enhygromyxa salina]
MEPSSRDLHPRTGARFVFDRAPGESPRYAVTIYLPGTERWSGRLSWIDERAELEPDQGQAPVNAEPYTWAHAEALKLARVLHRAPRQHMVRWRG